MDFSFDPSLRVFVLLADVAFLGFAALALLGAVVAVASKWLIHAVLGLATSLVGVAGMYVYLGTHFIAAMQVLIYVGAVCISLTFAVMLARPWSEAKQDPRLGPTKVGTGLVVALFAALVLGTTVFHTRWSAAQTRVEGTIAQVGERLLTQYAFVFELISLVLLVAIVGSVVLAKRGRGTPGGGP
ncbi:MAG: NADH-quinone oxidoreductase subunit J [Deferrisomatales bacterium]